MVFNIFDKTARVGNVAGLFTDYGSEDLVNELRYGFCGARRPGYYRSEGDRVLVYFGEEVQLLGSHLLRVFDKEVICLPVKQTHVVECFECVVDFSHNGGCRITLPWCVNVRVLDVFQALLCVGLSVLDDH